MSQEAEEELSVSQEVAPAAEELGAAQAIVSTRTGVPQALFAP